MFKIHSKSFLFIFKNGRINCSLQIKMKRKNRIRTNWYMINHKWWLLSSQNHHCCTAWNQKRGIVCLLLKRIFANGFRASWPILSLNLIKLLLIISLIIKIPFTLRSLLMIVFVFPFPSILLLPFPLSLFPFLPSLPLFQQHDLFY